MQIYVPAVPIIKMRFLALVFGLLASTQKFLFTFATNRLTKEVLMMGESSSANMS